MSLSLALCFYAVASKIKWHYFLNLSNFLILCNKAYLEKFIETTFILVVAAVAVAVMQWCSDGWYNDRRKLSRLKQNMYFDGGSSWWWLNQSNFFPPWTFFESCCKWFYVNWTLKGERSIKWSRYIDRT